MRKFIIGTVLALACGPVVAQDDPTEIDRTVIDYLEFAKQYLDALTVQKMCMDAFYEAYYGRQPPSRSFVDLVKEWARARVEGQLGVADATHRVILSTMKGARELDSQLELLNATDEELERAIVMYVQDCEFAGIQAITKQPRE